MSERLSTAFASGTPALVTFVTAGDGDTAAILDALVAGGAAVIELGMPFTDPMADGPAIQAANLRSLGAGTTTADILAIARGFRERHPEVPLVLMGYANPMLRRGPEWFARAAAKAGVDGVICVDIPPEEDDALGPALRAVGIDPIRLATPTTDAARLPAVLEGASGFLYYVSVAGITGLQQAQQSSIADAVARLKAATDLPVAVGFGIRTPEQAAAVARVADGVVVGSAIVELVATYGTAAAEPVRAYISSLAAAHPRGTRGYPMSWLSSVRNALSFVVPVHKETPDNLWHKCKGCGQMVFVKELEDNLYVCPHCDHHERIGPRLRFQYLFDEGSCEELPAPKVAEDPLKFRDSKRYADRLKAARTATGESDAFVNARGRIDGQQVVVGVQDFAFMGGSMGQAVGEAIVRGIEAAIEHRVPYVVFTASGGARMQEGILSLMQMPRSTVAIQMLHDAGLPYIVVLTDPTSGGVMAAYAMLGDVQIAEPKATLAFTGRRVIESTIREKLPDDFQTSEYYLEHGLIDMVVHRKELRERLATVIGYLCGERKAA